MAYSPADHAKSVAEAYRGRTASYNTYETKVNWGSTGYQTKMEKTLAEGRIVGYTGATVIMERGLPNAHTVWSPAASDMLTATLNPKCYYEYVVVDEIILVGADAKPDRVFPHTCPKCGSRALIMFRTVECGNSKCKLFAS